MFKKLFAAKRPTFGAVVFDAPGKTKRDEVYPQYKAQRDGVEDDLVPQLGRLHELISLLQVPAFAVPGFEGDDILAIIELPGVDKGDLQIQAKENTIRISGKKAINFQEGVSVHRRERISGEFDRTLSLPIQVNQDGIKAEYQNGVLALYLPRAESDKPRTIKVK